MIRPFNADVVSFCFHRDNSQRQACFRNVFFVLWTSVVVITVHFGLCIIAKAHRSSNASAKQHWYRGCFVSLNADVLF